MQTFFSTGLHILCHSAPVSSATNELELVCCPSDAGGGGGALPAPPLPPRGCRPPVHGGARPGFQRPHEFSRAQCNAHSPRFFRGACCPHAPRRAPAEPGQLSYSSRRLLSKEAALFFLEDSALNLYGMRRLESYAHTSSVLRKVMRPFPFFPTLRL